MSASQNVLLYVLAIGNYRIMSNVQTGNVFLIIMNSLLMFLLKYFDLGKQK